MVAAPEALFTEGKGLLHRLQVLFNSLQYVLFLAASVAAYFLVGRRLQVAVLLAASYFFYMMWRWEYAFLIAALTLVHYICGCYLGRECRVRRRQICLAVATIASLGTLAYYKYCNFFLESLGDVMAVFGWDAAMPHLRVILPVGISFYCFQALGYSIDVYQGKIPAEKSLTHFALYLAFFPQLVAGPIERAGHLLVQFKSRNAFDIVRFVEGGKLIAWGLFKKAVIADRLAFYVDRVYASPDQYSGATLLLATYFFAFQIYCDFSGYSDIAIGSARMLGYDLMQNFNLPYFATSVSDFWRRWHISLSTWFRDYVYLPLGGSRVSGSRWALSIMIVFLLSGFWHGANWTFVVWGGLHASYYLVEKAWCRLAQKWSPFWYLPSWCIRSLRIVLTFHLVLVGWVFFRAASLSQAGIVLSRIVTDLGGRVYLGPSQFTTLLSVLLIGVLLAYQYLQLREIAALYRRRTRIPLPLRFAGYAAILLGLAMLAVPANEFIYFQF